MGKQSNKKKSAQLGMNHATAAGRLRKKILFRMVQELERDLCYRCGEKIEYLLDLSIEHIIPWLDSDDPVGLYFDLDNIAFSHLSCNSGAARKSGPRKYKDGNIPHGTVYRYKDLKCRCIKCRKANADYEYQRRRK